MDKEIVKLNLGCGKDFLKGYKNLDKKDLNLEEKLKFKTNSVEKIVLKEVIEHIKNHQQLLKECKRVLVPNGSLYLTTPNYRGFGHRLSLAIGKDTFLRNFDHLRFFTDQTIVIDLEKAGFKIETIKGNSQTIKFLPVCLSGNVKIVAKSKEAKKK